MREGIDCKGVAWKEIEIVGKMIDITNQHFNFLTALFPVRSSGKVRWLCQCDCGNMVIVKTHAVKNGTTKSCGCFIHQKNAERWKKYRDDHNIIGQKFGRLKVLDFVGVEKLEGMYRCLCDCGETIVVRGHSLLRGNTKSCGCFSREIKDKTKYDLIGKKFGKLTVLGYAGINRYGGTELLCSCECGEQIIVSRNVLITGLQKSCGCIRSVGENNIKNLLDDNHIKYKQQQSFSDLISTRGGYPTYDFSILDNEGKIIRLIEFDGAQHKKPYNYFGGEEKFFKIQQNDTLKNQYALSHNIPLVRIPYKERDNITLDLIMGDKYLFIGNA